MNTQFHKNFPYGKGIWIWELWACVGKANISQVTPGDIATIIQKCKSEGLNYVLVKCGDGENSWQQWTPELITAFHDAGLKIYSWSYVYGDYPLREAAIAMWALDMGADGHVFDAEAEYQGKPQSATTMLEAVRIHNPDAFLAYAPFPIIDYHENYPYLEFGKYCNAVMPQMYAGDLRRSQLETIQWTYEQFLKWEHIWIENGFADSVQPIIPLGQAYDNPDFNYEQNASDIAEFIQGVKGYFSVCFWSYQHIYKQEVWDAINNNTVNLPTDQFASQTVTQATANTQDSQLPDQNLQTERVDVETPQSKDQPAILPSSERPEGTDKPEIWGVNSKRSIKIPSGKKGKKHIDYVRGFIILVLKGLKIA